MPYDPNIVPKEIDDRFIAQELRAISDSVGVIEEVLGLVEATNKEKAILRGSTTLTVDTLTAYPDSYIPPPPILSDATQLIALDKLAGTITTGRAGIYRLNGYVAQSAGQNNDAYAWVINASTVGQLFLGTQVFTNAVNGSVFSASVQAFLPAGEVLDIRSVDSLQNITVANSNLEVELITLEAFA